MPGFNQQQLNYSARNGNGVAIYLGDTNIAFAQTTSHNNDMGNEGLYGVGTAKPQEIQQMKMTPQVSIDAFALTQAGIAKFQGGISIPLILADNQFTLVIMDGITDNVLFTYVGCVAGGYSETISANQVVSYSINFLALDCLGPDGTSMLEGQNAIAVQSNGGALVNGGLGISVGGSVNIAGVSIGGGFSI